MFLKNSTDFVMNKNYVLVRHNVSLEFKSLSIESLKFAVSVFSTKFSKNLTTLDYFFDKLGNISTYYDDLSLSRDYFFSMGSRNDLSIRSLLNDFSENKGFFNKPFVKAFLDTPIKKSIVSKTSVLTSPHVDKIGQEQFEMRYYTKTVNIFFYSCAKISHNNETKLFYDDLITYFLDMSMNSFFGHQNDYPGVSVKVKVTKRNF
jgi:hypothetical protein